MECMHRREYSRSTKRKTAAGSLQPPLFSSLFPIVPGYCTTFDETFEFELSVPLLV